MQARTVRPPQANRRVIERRNIVSSIFVVALIAIAFHEMVIAVHNTLQTHGASWNLFYLTLVFFLTSLRFFMGNQLHLIDYRLLQMKGIVWFYDFMVLVFQTT